MSHDRLTVSSVVSRLTRFGHLYLSFSNYGGVSGRSTYSHEVVSGFSSHPSVDDRHRLHFRLSSLYVLSQSRLCDSCLRAQTGSPADTVATSSPSSPSRSTSTCVSSSGSTLRRSRSSSPSRESPSFGSIGLLICLPAISAPFLAHRSKTGTVYICNGCESHHIQSFGKVVESAQNRGPGMNYQYKNVSGPPVGARCDECGSAHHVSRLSNDHRRPLLSLH